MIISALLLASTVSSAQTLGFALPGITSCTSGSSDHACRVQLEDSGYIVDASTGKPVFAKAEPQGTSFDYSLYQSGDSLILEYSNTSASANWAALVFTYKNGAVRFTNYLSLAKDILPAGIHWSGQECHGNVESDRNSSPFKSAFHALCKENSHSDSLSIPETVSTTTGAKNGLVVSIPSYDVQANSWSKATYLFASNKSPTANALLCIDGCGRNSNEQHLAGWIDKSLWIDMSLTKVDVGNVSGSYFYIKKNTPIAVKGHLGEGEIDVSEYASSGSKATAQFSGKRFGDTYVGTWSSAEKKYDFFLATRLY